MQLHGNYEPLASVSQTLQVYTTIYRCNNFSLLSLSPSLSFFLSSFLGVRECVYIMCICMCVYGVCACGRGGGEWRPEEDVECLVPPFPSYSLETRSFELGARLAASSHPVFLLSFPHSTGVTVANVAISGFSQGC